MSDELDDYEEGEERAEAREDELQRELVLADAAELGDSAGEQDETPFDETRLAYSGVEEGDGDVDVQELEEAGAGSTIRSGRHHRPIGSTELPRPSHHHRTTARAGTMPRQIGISAIGPTRRRGGGVRRTRRSPPGQSTPSVALGRQIDEDGAKPFRVGGVVRSCDMVMVGRCCSSLDDVRRAARLEL